MHDIQELHEEIDEVNFFLREWQRLATCKNPHDLIVKKPEIRFVSHAIERVLRSASNLNIPLILKTGAEPVLAKGSSKQSHRRNKPNHNWLIPSGSSIELNNFQKLKTSKNILVTYVGNDNGLLSLRILAETVALGGELRITGKHAGDWSA